MLKITFKILRFLRLQVIRRSCFNAEQLIALGTRICLYPGIEENVHDVPSHVSPVHPDEQEHVKSSPSTSHTPP